MTIGQLILEYIQTLLWPLILIAGVIAFREPIAQLLPRLRSAKVGSAEASFDSLVDSAASSVRDAKSELVHPKATTARTARASAPPAPHDVGDVDLEESEDREWEEFDEEEMVDGVNVQDYASGKFGSHVVPSVGYVITHSEMSKIRHPSRGGLLARVAVVIEATGLPVTPNFRRQAAYGSSDVRKQVSELWVSLERYLSELCFGIVTVASLDGLDDRTKDAISEDVQRYRSGAYPEDLLERIGRLLSLRSISAVSIAVSKLREIAEEAASVERGRSVDGLRDKYQDSCQGVVDVLDVIFRGYYPDELLEELEGADPLS